METITVKSIENLQQLVVTSSHGFVADEPKDDGDDLGPNPYELLLSALGTCTAMTVLMYVRRKEWPLKSISVECSHERVHCRDSEDCEEDRGGLIDVIHRKIVLEGDLSDEQRERIGYIAAKCPVHKTLSSRPVIRDVLSIAG